MMRKIISSILFGILLVFSSSFLACAEIEDNSLQFDSERIEEEENASQATGAVRASELFVDSERELLKSNENQKIEAFLNRKAELFTEENLEENKNMQAVELFVESEAAEQYQKRIASANDYTTTGRFLAVYGGLLLLAILFGAVLSNRVMRKEKEP